MNEFLHINNNNEEKSIEKVETANEEITEDDGLEVYISEITGIDVDTLRENLDWYISMLEDENGLKDLCI